jgi:hypothetical protein
MTWMTTLPLAALVGALSGLHASIWGMYKDAIHEGFGWRRFFRSVIIGAASAVALHACLGLDVTRPSAWLLLFGLAYAVERGVVETWKTFLRDEDQSKYFIPMQLSLRGRPVKSRRLRMFAGVGYVIVVGAILVAIDRLDRRLPPGALTTVVVGFVVGLVIAIGGAWKDAPKEGFDLLKFFRSPAMTVAYALLLSAFTSRNLLVAAAAIGFERATAETWKTFFFPSKPRGKFTGKPITHPHMLATRQWLIPPYAAIWIAVVIVGALAFASPGSMLAQGQP